MGCGPDGVRVLDLGCRCGPYGLGLGHSVYGLGPSCIVLGLRVYWCRQLAVYGCGWAFGHGVWALWCSVCQFYWGRLVGIDRIVLLLEISV